jgi:hypothetical protein
MTRTEQIRFLTGRLLDELPQYREQAARFPDDEVSRRRLLRSLMNVRPPLPLSADFLAVQDALLSAETAEKGVVDPAELPPAGEPGLYLWQGDITRLAADAIVNAANSALLGCFLPCHGCIDNAIHSAAGCSCGTSAIGSCARRAMRSPPGGPSSRRATIFRRDTCFTRWAPSCGAP